MFTFLHVLYSIGVILLIVLLKSCFQLYKNYLKIKHIPGVCQLLEYFPIRIPFLSTYYYLTSIEHLDRAVEQYGDKETKTLSLATASAPVVWISDPKLLKEYFIAKGNFFEKQEIDLIKYFGEENIVSAINNDKWKKHYKICSKAFTPRNLMYVCKVADKSCQSLFEQWDEKLEKNSSFVLDVNDYSDLTLDILGKAGFNLDFGIYSDNVKGKIFRHHMEKLLSATAIFLLLLFSSESFWYKLGAKLTGLEEANNYCSKYLDEIIEERKKAQETSDNLDNDDNSDILSLLVSANVKEQSISNGQLQSNTLMLSVAGHETVCSLCIIFAKIVSRPLRLLLGKSPEIQEKLWEEVDRVLQGRNPTYEDHQSLPYVNAILMESLRLHSPVNDLPRVAIKNVTLGDFEIPKGTVVRAMISHVQKREDIWENAKEFKPERFLDPNIKENSQHNYTFASFSLGNRQCLGKNFALLEAFVILSKLAQQYEFKLLNDERVDPVGVVQIPVVKPSTNMKLQITKRKH